MPYLIPRTSQPITLDANGNGQTEFVIDNSNRRWIIDYVSVATDQAPTATPIPRAVIYRNSIDNGHVEGGTSSGNFDFSQGRTILYPDDTLYVVWSGGIPGSRAWATIKGTFDPAGAPLSDS